MYRLCRDSEPDVKVFKLILVPLHHGFVSIVFESGQEEADLALTIIAISFCGRRQRRLTAYYLEVRGGRTSVLEETTKGYFYLWNERDFLRQALNKVER